MQKYGKFLKNERVSRKLSQEQLAKEIGITQQAISFYENNVNEPSISICERLADFYGISIDELIGRDKIPQRKNAVIYNHSTHNGNNNF